MQSFYSVFEIAKILFNFKWFTLSKENTGVFLKHIDFLHDYQINEDDVSELLDLSNEKISLLDKYKINLQHSLLNSYISNREVEQNISLDGTKLTIKDSVIPCYVGKQIFLVYVADQEFVGIAGSKLKFTLKFNNNGEVFLDCEQADGELYFNLLIKDDAIINFNSKIFKSEFDFISYDLENIIEINNSYVKIDSPKFCDCDESVEEGHIVHNTNCTAIKNMCINLIDTDVNLYNFIDKDILAENEYFLIDLIKIFKNVEIPVNKRVINYSYLQEIGIDKQLIIIDGDINYSAEDTVMLKIFDYDLLVNITDDIYKLINFSQYWNFDELSHINNTEAVNLNIYDKQVEINPFQINDFSYLNNNGQIEPSIPSYVELVDNDEIITSNEISESIKLTLKNGNKFVNTYKSISKINSMYDDSLTNEVKIMTEFDLVFTSHDFFNYKTIKIEDVAQVGDKFELYIKPDDIYINVCGENIVINSFCYNQEIFKINTPSDINANLCKLTFDKTEGSIDIPKIGEEVVFFASSDDTFNDPNNLIFTKRSTETLLNEYSFITNSWFTLDDTLYINNSLKKFFDYYNNNFTFAVIYAKDNELILGKQSIKCYKVDEGVISEEFPDDDYLEYIKCKHTNSVYKFFLNSGSRLKFIQKQPFNIEFDNISNPNFNLQASDIVFNTDEIELSPYSNVSVDKASYLLNVQNIHTGKQSHLDLVMEVDSTDFNLINEMVYYTQYNSKKINAYNVGITEYKKYTKDINETEYKIGNINYSDLVLQTSLNFNEQQLILKNDLFEDADLVGDNLLTAFYRIDNIFNCFENSKCKYVQKFEEFEKNGDIYTEDIILTDHHFYADFKDTYLYFQDFQEIVDNNYNIRGSYILTNNSSNISHDENFGIVVDSNRFDNLNNNVRTYSVQSKDKMQRYYNNIQIGDIKLGGEFYLFYVQSSGSTRFDTMGITGKYKGNIIPSKIDNLRIAYKDLAIYKNENIDLEVNNIYEYIFYGLTTPTKSIVNSKSFDLHNTIEKNANKNFMYKRKFDFNLNGKVKNNNTDIITITSDCELLDIKNGNANLIYKYLGQETIDGNNINFDNIIGSTPNSMFYVKENDKKEILRKNKNNNLLFSTNILNNETISEIYSVVVDFAEEPDPDSLYRKEIIPCYETGENIFTIDSSTVISLSSQIEIIYGNNKSKNVSITPLVGETNTFTLIDDLVPFIKGIVIYKVIETQSIELHIKELNVNGLNVEVITQESIVKLDGTAYTEYTKQPGDRFSLIKISNFNDTGDSFGDDDVMFGVNDEKYILSSVFTASKKNIPLVAFCPTEKYNPDKLNNFFNSDDMYLKSNDILSLSITEGDYDKLLSLQSDSVLSEQVFKFNNKIHKFIGCDEYEISLSTDNIVKIQDVNDWYNLKTTTVNTSSKLSDFITIENNSDKPTKYFLNIPKIHKYEFVNDLINAGENVDNFSFEIYKKPAENSNISISELFSDDIKVVNKETIISKVNGDDFILKENQLMCLVYNYKSKTETFANGFNIYNLLQSQAYYFDLLKLKIHKFVTDPESNEEDEVEDEVEDVQRINDLYFKKYYKVEMGTFYASSKYVHGTMFNTIENVEYAFATTEKFKNIQDFLIYKKELTNYELHTMNNKQEFIIDIIDSKYENLDGVLTNMNNYKILKKIGDK